MNQPLEQFATVGLVHHLFYPDCVRDPAGHADSLEQFIERRDMQTYDLAVPYDPALRRRLIPKIRAAAERMADTAYAIHLFPMRKISLGTTNGQERDLVKLILRDQIEVAAAVGASKFVFISGPSDAQVDRAKSWAAFADMCKWLCDALRPHQITAVVEMFDTDVDKKFMCGHSAECVDMIQSLRPNTDNLGILLDVAHIRLLGEPLDEAIRTCAPCLERVHFGNCVLKDKADHYYGDLHPPIGYAGGEIDVPELTVALRALKEVGYLRPDRRGSILTEFQPVAGKSLDEWVADNHRRVNEALAAVDD